MGLSFALLLFIWLCQAEAWEGWKSAWKGSVEGRGSSAGMNAMNADGCEATMGRCGIFLAHTHHRITWRNNLQTLGSDRSVQVRSGGSLSHPTEVSSKKGFCCWEVGKAWGVFCLGKPATGKRMRQHEWNIPLQLNWRSSTAVGRQTIFTLPLYSPLQHPPPLWGNDIGETTSENWALASSKCAGQKAWRLL